MKPSVRVKFDDVSIVVLRDDKEAWMLEWKDVERIGYRTTPAGPLNDYFLVFKKKGNAPLYFDVSMDWPGAVALSEYIDKLPNTKLPAAGKLANCVENRSVTIWPAEMSGQPL